jgi:hypothetical protein
VLVVTSWLHDGQNALEIKAIQDFSLAPFRLVERALLSLQSELSFCFFNDDESPGVGLCDPRCLDHHGRPASSSSGRLRGS